MRNKYFRLLLIAVVLFVIFGYFKLEAEKNRVRYKKPKMLFEHFTIGSNYNAVIDEYVNDSYFLNDVKEIFEFYERGWTY